MANSNKWPETKTRLQNVAGTKIKNKCKIFPRNFGTCMAHIVVVVLIVIVVVLLVVGDCVNLD